MARQSFEISALHAAYARGLTPRDMTDEVIRRIAAVGDPGIFLHLRDADALADEAAALPPFDPDAYPLWGIPFAIKDNIDLGGTPTTAACPAFAYTAGADAFAVAALRRAGAIPVGKTNLDQFATGLVGVRSPYPVPRNAIDPVIVPGGSSSGSAVAVAHGIVSFALGTDTAGSGRVPAALNNIVGLKPSLGAISNTGAVPACRTLDTISIFALTVDDAWRAFRAACVYDPADPYARDMPAPPLGSAPPAFSVGVPDSASRRFFGDTAQAASFEAALAEVEAIGGRIVEIDLQPFYDVAEMLYEGAWVAERMAVVEDLMRDDPGAILPVTRQIIGAADGLTAVDAFRGFYRLAELRRAVTPVIDGVDLLCVPTIPTFYSVDDLARDPVGPNSRLGTYTNFVNLLDLCGIAVPCGTRVDGRPASVTFLAKAGRDQLVAGIARELHSRTAKTLGATGLAVPPVPATRAPVGTFEMEIAVVGAHMSGLPLNRELTERGGRFVRAATTTGQYRLYLLPGGPPARPGLVKCDKGQEIPLEVWALPKPAFGDFLAGVPSPLTIGTVHLADGTAVKGFLAEAGATKGQTDISHLGGWRGYLASAG